MDTRSVMKKAVELAASVDALAALAAFLRIENEGLPADPAVRALLSEVAAELLGDTSVDGDIGPVLGLVRTFLRQAAELVDNPGRSGAWDQVDVPLLQSIGRLSMGIADAIVVAADRVPGLGERLRGPDRRFLDVGTGTGWLAVAVARTHPELAVVGIDVFEPALDLAAGNVREQSLDDRISLKLLDACELNEPDAYDAIWLPLPFLPKPIVPTVIAASTRSLRPGGWILAGTFTGPPTRLGDLLTDLRTVRSGGHPWHSADLIAELSAAGLAEVGEVERTWQAPVRLYVGSRHSPG